ncbi:MAG: hypothetical protein EPN97_03210 [Alphaproteobacteria bacterium]|nr:MAG: hypothetical protein EPN97_03210 [Alphaproteobacteria bacterium]
MADETPKPPLGQRLRDLINPALEDERAKPLQSQIVSDIFGQIADNVPKMFERELSSFFNHVSSAPERKKTPIIINALTVAQGQEGEPAFNPIKKLQLPVSTSFTSFSAEDIRDMPGWIKLHEVCRDMDISIKLMSMTTEESKGSLMPPLLILDASKSYNDGAIENAQLYPQLADKPKPFDKKTGQEFHF